MLREGQILEMRFSRILLLYSKPRYFCPARYIEDIWLFAHFYLVVSISSVIAARTTIHDAFPHEWTIIIGRFSLFSRRRFTLHWPYFHFAASRFRWLESIYAALSMPLGQYARAIPFSRRRFLLSCLLLYGVGFISTRYRLAPLAPSAAELLYKAGITSSHIVFSAISFKFLP